MWIKIPNSDTDTGQAAMYSNVCHASTRLVLTLAERRDEGTYYCVSKNELGITRGNIQVFSEYQLSIELDMNLRKG